MNCKRTCTHASITGGTGLEPAVRSGNLFPWILRLYLSGISLPVEGAQERRNAVLRCYARWWGPKMLEPVVYLEKYWKEEVSLSIPVCVCVCACMFWGGECRYFSLLMFLPSRDCRSTAEGATWALWDPEAFPIASARALNQLVRLCLLDIELHFCLYVFHNYLNLSSTSSCFSLLRPHPLGRHGDFCALVRLYHFKYYLSCFFPQPFHPVPREILCFALQYRFAGLLLSVISREDLT